MRSNRECPRWMVFLGVKGAREERDRGVSEGQWDRRLEGEGAGIGGDGSGVSGGQIIRGA